MSRGHGRDHGVKAASWWGVTIPTTGPVGTALTWVGIAVQFSVNGRLAGLRRYDNTTEDGNTWFVVWDLDANSIPVAGVFRPRAVLSGNAWHNTWFNPWRRITVGHRYYVGVVYPFGHYFRNNSAVTSPPVTHSNIELWGSWQSTSFYFMATTPTGNTNANAIDVLFYPD